MTTMTKPNLVLSAGSLKGNAVRNPSGEDLGKIEEIMINAHSGHVAYAVLSFGGILGFGDKLFSIPWSLLSVDTENHCCVLDIDRKLLENAPGFDKDNWPNFSDMTWHDEVHTYYGARRIW
ncbi:MAG: PRC-barrel domain-containing protein [Gemmatimonadetes bacterium]|nr:PRC-barrel domain-containing protein [Gemmatimonadota bacterium]